MAERLDSPEQAALDIGVPSVRDDRIIEEGSRLSTRERDQNLTSLAFNAFEEAAIGFAKADLEGEAYDVNTTGVGTNVFDQVAEMDPEEVRARRDLNLSEISAARRQGIISAADAEARARARLTRSINAMPFLADALRDEYNKFFTPNRGAKDIFEVTAEEEAQARRQAEYEEELMGIAQYLMPSKFEGGVMPSLSDFTPEEIVHLNNINSRNKRTEAEVQALQLRAQNIDATNTIREQASQELLGTLYINESKNQLESIIAELPNIPQDQRSTYLQNKKRLFVSQMTNAFIESNQRWTSADITNINALAAAQYDDLISQANHENLAKAVENKMKVLNAMDEAEARRQGFGKTAIELYKAMAPIFQGNDQAVNILVKRTMSAVKALESMGRTNTGLPDFFSPYIDAAASSPDGTLPAYVRGAASPIQSVEEATAVADAASVAQRNADAPDAPPEARKLANELIAQSGLDLTIFLNNAATVKDMDKLFLKGSLPILDFSGNDLLSDVNKIVKSEGQRALRKYFGGIQDSMIKFDNEYTWRTGQSPEITFFDVHTFTPDGVAVFSPEAVLTTYFNGKNDFDGFSEMTRYFEDARREYNKYFPTRIRKFVRNNLNISGDVKTYHDASGTFVTNHHELEPKAIENLMTAVLGEQFGITLGQSRIQRMQERKAAYKPNPNPRSGAVTMQPEQAPGMIWNAIKDTASGLWGFLKELPDRERQFRRDFQNPIPPPAGGELGTPAMEGTPEPSTVPLDPSLTRNTYMPTESLEGFGGPEGDTNERTFVRPENPRDRTYQGGTAEFR